MLLYLLYSVVSLANRYATDNIRHFLRAPLAQILGDQIAAQAEPDADDLRARVLLGDALQHHVIVPRVSCRKFIADSINIRNAPRPWSLNFECGPHREFG